jgi:hypothetical protein
MHSANPLFYTVVLTAIVAVAIGCTRETSSPSSPTPPLTLSPQESERVCKGVVSALFNHPIDEVQVVRSEGDMIYLSHTRKSDNTVWRIKCRLRGNTIIWGNDDGRWRTDPMDEKLSFDFNRVARTFTVRQIFTDGSEIPKTFSIE